jgi:hypothetical protein
VKVAIFNIPIAIGFKNYFSFGSALQAVLITLVVRLLVQFLNVLANRVDLFAV